MNQKRIVIIEGDAFDADAIVAIINFRKRPDTFAIFADGMEAPTYSFPDEATRDAAMTVAVLAWRKAVGDVMSIPTADPLPPPPQDEPDHGIVHWSDEKGRFYQTYGGKPVYTDGNTGDSFIWNEGPPRRKNTLGPGASPILKTYVDESGKPLANQPV